MTDPFELKRAAEQLRHQYAQLEQLKHTPARTPLARKMKPTFGPQSCAPDGDWALNIELLLVDEGDDDNPNAEAPSGLFNMVIDAQRYIHNRTIQTKDGHRLANFIALHSGAIANQFPAADDLLTLLRDQTQYIQVAIQKRHGGPTRIQRELANVKPTGHGTAADLAPLVSAAIGHTITRKTITYWGRSGRITQHLNDDGTSLYELAEAIDAAKNYQDQRRRTSLD